jgi:ATP-dependent Zn protease
MNKYIITAAIICSSSIAIAYTDEHDLTNPSQSLKVTDSTFTIIPIEGRQTLTVIGTFKNTTANKIDNIVVEAKFMDLNKKVVDVMTQPVYGIVVPANQEVSFRLQGLLGASQNSYSVMEARVSSGETHIERQASKKKSEDSLFMNLLVSWGPMLLLIGTWIFFMKKSDGKNSAQNRTLDLIAEQNLLFTKQLSAIENIADAANKLNKN